MKTVGALALLLLAALAVPTASAQEVQGVTAVPGALAAPIPYEGSANLSVSGMVGCAEILAAMADAMGPTATLTLSVASPPAWLTVGEATTNLASQESITDCAGGTGSRAYTLDLPLTVSKDAPGVVDHTINVVASIADATSEPAPAIITVAYHWNYTVVSDATFPMTVDGPSAMWNVTVTQASNARSMVMMEEIATSAGVLSGPASQAYENDAGLPATKTFLFKWQAPEGAWTNATASFTAYGHYLLLDGRAGDYDEGTPVTYTFVAGEHAEHHEEEEGDKESPAPVGAFIALGLVALAALVRRRA